MISFIRIDNRLIHGQVVEAWLPVLKVGRVVVADDEASDSPLMRAAMGLAVPPGIEVDIARLDDVPFARLAQDAVRTLVLLRDLPALLRAKGRGLPVRQLNLGNIHHGPGRRQVTASVYLTADELEQLRQLEAVGVELEGRGVPTERPIPLAEMAERFQKG
ncbi:MAG TPA: PTS sugar transporter subunit IIB [Myxococcaceae bacterium]|nr:PTS sugar transporter subunit IIB [Myxococcaceae bacterium]